MFFLENFHSGEQRAGEKYDRQRKRGVDDEGFHESTMYANAGVRQCVPIPPAKKPAGYSINFFTRATTSFG